MCEHAASCDARALHIGSYSAWLSKVKGDGARVKWMSGSNKRYFTIDFDSQLFYYSHSEDRKKISNPVRFADILGAEQLPRPSQPSKKSNDFTFGFVIQTPGRSYELYTITYLDAKHWVDALLAARDIAIGGSNDLTNNTQALQAEIKPQDKHSRSRELSRSSMSTTADGTADGSDSGRSEEHGDLSSYGGYTAGFAGPPPPRGPQPVQPPIVRQPPISYSGGYATPTPAGGALPRGSQGSSVPVAPRHLSSGAAPPASRDFPPVAPPAPAPAPEEVDPFAALDALEELAGPLPEQALPTGAVAPQQNIQGALLREARAIVTKKGSKPSAEATEALQRLKSNPASFDALGGAQPLAAQAVPVVAAAPAPAPAPLAPAPAPAHAPLAPLSAAPVGAPPPAAVSAMTQHNPAAESWDSDDDETPQRGGFESPKRGLLAHQAPAPAAPAPQRRPPATTGWAEPAAAPAPLAQAPISAGPAVQQGDASGWDSDDDAQQVARPLHHQQAVSAGPHQGTEASGWDSDDDAAPKVQARAKNTCGAPVRPQEAFVVAKTRPAPAPAPVQSGDDLDDLVGEVLAADTSASSRGGPTSGPVPGFQCTACDFQVMRIDGFIWSTAVDYMFFRNNYPNVKKLRSQMVARRDCCAYCCQCSWKSAECAAPLADVAEGLRWRTVGC